MLETGLGGLMDATNVVENTLVTILTSISRDHMAFLGESLSEIATHKAGIIKKSSYVVALEGEPEVEAVIMKTAEERQAKVVTLYTKQTFEIAVMVWKNKKFLIKITNRWKSLWRDSISSSMQPLP